MAINFLAAGLTVVIAQTWFSQGGRTPQLPSEARFGNIVLPGAESTIREIAQMGPLGQIYSELISGHSILVYIAFLIVPLTWWVLFRTRFGLRLRAVGENPAAVDTAGISVVGMRYAAVIICGVLCGLAGAYLATALNAGFVKDMSAGRGYIALAALIFAKWRPWYALMACLLFGFFDAVGNRFQNITVGEDRRAGAVHAGAALHPRGHRACGARGQGPFRRAQEGSLMSRNAEELAALIRDRAGNTAPKVGLVLGSGLGASGRGGGRRRHRLHRPARCFRMRASRATTRNS